MRCTMLSGLVVFSLLWVDCRGARLQEGWVTGFQSNWSGWSEFNNYEHDTA